MINGAVYAASDADMTKKDIEKLIKTIKENSKKAQDLFEEAKAIADNLKYTAGQKIKILEITIKREGKNKDTDPNKLQEAVKIQKEAKSLYAQSKYREVLDIVDKALRLICTVPVISLDIKPMIFSPDGDGINDTVTIAANIFAKDPAKVTDWSLVIKKRNEKKDDDSIEIYTQKGKGMPPAALTWDGKKDGALIVDSVNNYMAELSVKDNNGEGTSGNVLFMTDVFLEKTERGMRVNVSAIQFDGDKSDLKEQYHYLLKRIYNFLLEYPEYKTIVVEGHTSYGPVKKNVKLSNDRAASVKKYLLSLGMNPDRIITKGYSHSVPFTLEVKKFELNRRVTFFLLKDKEDKENYEKYFQSIEKIFEVVPKFVK